MKEKVEKQSNKNKLDDRKYTKNQSPNKVRSTMTVTKKKQNKETNTLKIQTHISFWREVCFSIDPPCPGCYGNSFKRQSYASS
jgi:hypothetical protein